MFHMFSSIPLRPPSRDVLQEVQDILETGGMTFGSLITSALQDTTTSLGATVVTELTSILEALRPHLDEDEIVRASLGQFFASIASPELSQFKNDNSETGWNLPATNLLTEQLMEFSLDEMGKKIALDTPGFSSFLNDICGGLELDDSGAGVSMDVDRMAEDDPESEEKAR